MDTCPISGDQHRLFLFKTFETFEPVDIAKKLYKKIEYGVSGCNCGYTAKTEIKQL